MKTFLLTAILLLLLLSAVQGQQSAADANEATLLLESSNFAGNEPLRISGLFFETAQGRTVLPAQITKDGKRIKSKAWRGEVRLPDGRQVTANVVPQGKNFMLRLTAQPATGIIKWGLLIDARADEYYTGLMERVVDGPQAASWAPGRSEALNLRGQRVEMIVKPTTSIYAPFYISSRGYAVFVQGQMEKEALGKGYGLAGQKRPANGYNYPTIDLTNPAAKSFWQSGVAKLLQLGVAAFKLDRGEEDMPDDGPFKVFDGRSIRENRNAYVAMYVKATYEIAAKFRGQDFVLMPRGAYTGSSPYGVFWGGDIGGTQEGLRASIIAVQRAAIMGYPNWGSDTCGYNQQLLEQEVCGRWLGFSAFTPIMEVGPTRNVAFWNLPREPAYDTELIAIWRLYARLHQRLIDYNFKYAQEANRTGMPIVRPLFLVEPGAPAAWANWWTYLYGSDILVSPIWEKGKRTQQVYLPAGSSWRDAWAGKVYQGGQTVTVNAELHQIPLFIRSGSKVNVGDLNQEWRESHAIAEQKPNLKELDAELKRSQNRER